MTMPTPDASFEEALFWGLVEWAEAARLEREPIQALRVALENDAHLRQRWLAAMLLDPAVRERYFDDQVEWEEQDEYLAWLSGQPDMVVTALPEIMVLAGHYERVNELRHAAIVVSQRLGQLSPRLSEGLLEAKRAGRRLGQDGATNAPYFWHCRRGLEVFEESN